MKKFLMSLAVALYAMLSICVYAQQSNQTAEEIWRPLNEVVFNFINGEWKKDSEYRNTYDLSGNITSQEKYIFAYEDLWDPYLSPETYIEYAYDDMGHLVRIKDYSTGAWTGSGESYPNRMITNMYDEVISDLITTHFDVHPEPNSYSGWASDNTGQASYHIDIMRDGKGNVYRMSKSNPDDHYLNVDFIKGSIDCSNYFNHYYYDWFYDKNQMGPIKYKFDYTEGRPSFWSWEYANKGEATNIIWNRTDGQMIGDLFEMTSGNNRLKSCDFHMDGYDYFGNIWPYAGTISVEYPSKEGPDFIMKIMHNDKIYCEKSLTTTDLNGSYKYIITKYYDGRYEYTDTPFSQYEESHVFNSYGDLIHETHQSFNNDNYQMEYEVEIEYEYDENDNVITKEIKESYPYFTGNQPTLTRHEYSDYYKILSTSVSNTHCSLKWNLSDNILHIQDYDMNEVKIFSMQGYVVHTLRCKDEVRIDLSSYPKGIYIAQTISDTGIQGTICFNIK